MDRDNQDAAALRDYGDEEPSSVASPKVNSKVNREKGGISLLAQLEHQTFNECKLDLYRVIMGVWH